MKNYCLLYGRKIKKDKYKNKMCIYGIRIIEDKSTTTATPTSKTTHESQMKEYELF